MQAIQVFDYGERDALRLADVPPPVPGEGEALVRLRYAGVNFIDVYMRKGLYRHSDTYGAELPIILGMEGGGTVAAVGPGVGNVRPGDLVAYVVRDRGVRLERVDPFDAEYHRAISETLQEWSSPADDEAFRDL